jgi:hypothetical protein
LSKLQNARAGRKIDRDLHIHSSSLAPVDTNFALSIGQIIHQSVVDLISAEGVTNHF